MAALIELFALKIIDRTRINGNHVTSFVCLLLHLWLLVELRFANPHIRIRESS